jgi:hypothetical protein
MRTANGSPICHTQTAPRPAGRFSFNRRFDSLEKAAKSPIVSRGMDFGLLAELADAVDSKSTARKGISVRLR